MHFQKFNLSDEIIKGLDNLGYETVLPIQEQVIPVLLAKRDVVIISQTGSGKSASFLIPAIADINWDLRAVQTLVIAPTRELSAQLMEEADAIGLYRKIQTVLLNGREKYEPQIQRLKRAHLAIGTPGRILDHIKRGTLSLEQISYIVLDEADVLLDMGFQSLVEEILSHVSHPFTIALCSATMDERIQSLCEQYLHEPVICKVEIAQMSLKQKYCILREEQKYDFICSYVAKNGFERVIVFCNRKESVEAMYEKMRAEGISVTRIHGELLQKERYEAINQFQKGKYRFLLASDVAGRGLDISDVQLIVQYDLPEDVRKYIHRMGRSARLDASGENIALVTKQFFPRWELVKEQLSEVPKRVEMTDFTYNVDQLQAATTVKSSQKELARKQVATLYLHGGKDKKIRPGDIVGALCHVDGVSGDDIGVIEVKQHGSYVELLQDKGQLFQNISFLMIKKKRIKVEFALKSKMER